MKVDIGKMNSRYFINIAGGGRLTELTYEVPIKLKTRFGRLTYYLKVIKMLPSLKSMDGQPLNTMTKSTRVKLCFFS
jgi:diacylglycerol kinase (ATP)